MARGGGTQYNSRLHMMVPHGWVKMKKFLCKWVGVFLKYEDISLKMGC